MKRFFLIPILALGSISFLAYGDEGDTDTVYRINEHGSRQFYEVDMTSAHAGGSRDGLKSLKLANSPENMKAYKASFRARSKAAGKKLGVVFYPKGYKHNSSLMRVLRDRMVIRVKDANGVAAISKRLGAQKFKVVKSEGAVYAVLTFTDAIEVLDKIEVCKNDADVLFAKPLLSRNIKKMTTTPSDPRFAYGAGNTEYQWHLWNTGQNNGVAGVDINVRDVWDDYTGAGVIIAVADDGLEINHPDLVGNTSGMVHYNWPYAKSDPTPEVFEIDSHGTSVAGVSAASWNNGIGGVGSAPEANLVGLRWLVFNDDFEPDVEDIGDVLGWGQTFGLDKGAADIDVHNNSWGPSHDTFLAPMEPLEIAGMEAGIENGRDGLGTIYLFAGGNSREDDGNANYGGYVASRYTIGVGAINDQGAYSVYSNPGCALIISAPSNGGSGRQGITTTELQSLGTGYTDQFGGTSSATPLTAGVVALMLEANPNLGWRDVQEILIASARKNDAFDQDWQDNANGYHFNHNYGAGMVDASAAVNLAKTWVNLEEETSVLVSQSGLGQDIPDGGSTEVEIDFSTVENKRVENVLVKLNIIHPRRNDLECVLISPSGMESRLTESFSGELEEDINYTFLSTFNWGENSVGVWKVRVFDRVNGTSGTIEDVDIEIFGVYRDPELPPVALGSNRIGFMVDSTVDFPIEGLYFDSVSLSRGVLPPGLTLDGVENKIVGNPTDTGVWFMEFTLTNEYGTTNYPVRITIGDNNLASDLAEAIEQPTGSVSTTGLYGLFDLQFTDIPDGSDAIASVIDIEVGTSGLPLSSYGEAHVTLPHSGGGIVMFDWKVESAESVDRFWFSPSAGSSAIIGWHGFMSGDRDWGTFASPLPSGATTLGWSYMENQDSELNGGGGRGLLDQVKIYTEEEYSSMLTEYSGSDLTFKTDHRALWTPTMAFLPLDVEVDAAKVLQASSIGNAQYSDLVTEVEGPGLFTFRWRVSSEQGDKLQFIVAGTLREELSGDKEWAEYSLEIPAGSYSVLWRYIKDSLDSGNMDTAFISGISYIKYYTYEMWSEIHFSESELLDSDISGVEADPNANGVNNLLEYAFSGDPLDIEPAGIFPGVVFDEDGLGFTYRKNIALSDITYTMQTSTDLEEWDDVPGELVSTDGQYETYRYELTPSDSEIKRFLRVQIIK